MTTLKELSKHLGLSVTQVSRALNNHDDVSAKTKQRVKEAAKALNYHPNTAARRLVTGRSGIVGLVYPHMPDQADAWYFTQFVGGLSSRFSQHGMQFMLHMSDGPDRGLAIHDQLIRTRSIDGFVIIVPKANDKRVQLLRERKVPFVLHGQTMDQPDYPFYDIDNVAVGYDLTRLLVDAGHKNIAFINGEAGDSFVERRFTGYRKALAEAGLKWRDEWQICGTMTRELGLLETVRMFQGSGAKPTAIVASNMRILQGIFDAAKALGLSIPDDLSVVAHDDDLPDCPVNMFPVPITCTRAPLVQSWEPLAQLLERYLKGAVLSDVQEIASHELLERGSVRALR